MRLQTHRGVGVDEGQRAWEQRGDDKPIEDALVVKVKRADLAVEVIDTGKIEPREKVDIKSKVAGQVLEVLVDEGRSRPLRPSTMQAP